MSSATIEMPSAFQSWNPALRGAFRKGCDAFLAGENVDSCPYRDRRKDDGRLTWSRAFRAAWTDGWHHAKLNSTGGIEC